MLTGRLPLLLAVACCLAGRGAGGAPVDLGSDPRLAVRVTLHEPMITVRRLLARVEAACPMELTAEPELGEETVCVGAGDRPCGELLEQVAQALEYRWVGARSRNGESGYRLTEEQAVRLRRRSLARRYRRETSQELQTQLGLLEQFTRKLRGQDPKAVRDEIERLETRVRELPTSPERFQAELELHAARDSVDVRRRPLLLALAALPPAARERLTDGERLVMAARRPGAIPMPDEVLQALRAARGDLARETTSTAGSPVVTEDEAIDFLSHVAWGDLSLYVRARWLPGQQERLTFAVPTFLQSPSFVEFGPRPVDLLPGSVTVDRAEDLRRPIAFSWTMKQLQKDRPLTWYTGVTVAEVLGRLAESDPRWHVGGSALLEGIPSGRPAPIPGAVTPAADEPVGALLSRLSDRSRQGSLQLGELLEALAARGGVDLHVTRSGWIRFRSTRPFRARERQVDPEVLREVFGPAVEAPRLSVEAAMATGRRLTRTQLETLSAPHLGFPRHMTQNSGLRSAVDGWRMLDQLSDADRQALFDGGVLRYYGSSERSRSAVREYLQSVSTRPNGAPLDLELGTRDLPGLLLRLTPVNDTIRRLELRAGRLEPPIYTAALEAAWSPRDRRQ